ncbi:NAD-dependent epimerase/dehydratase family protein [Streptomyces triticirhizae]|uniref:NAD(P)-dependent oxidoreductase n=1 Tax=Streptomyces triticirhizae TaxID=2483353 RepID=A0A3M2LES4_9ACTN|nr:NAD(P)-dependent oxidoreductase [Streptomyces triticirhizae]RMI36031.1 NAD(P)-dependent oxidoreductase [Streptomyces triticirhizae]
MSGFGPPPRRVVVLGATGCMGRRITRAFADQGTEVTAVARRGPAPPGADRLRTLDAARETAGRLAELLVEERAEAVVNATLGWGDDLHSTNVTVVEHLLAALACLPAPPRLVHLGTIHEYGPVPHGTSIDETVPPRPQQPYPRSKLTAAKQILAASAAGTVDATVLRLTNTIGPEPAEESFFGSLAARLRDEPDTIELTVADAHRDYLDSRDAADAVVRAAAAPTGHGVLNLGSGEARPIADLVDALVRASGRPPESVLTRAGSVASRGGDWIRVDNGRARRLLGWRPRHDPDASMRALWNSVRAATLQPR